MSRTDVTMREVMLADMYEEQIDRLTAENKMLRNNIATRINGTEEIKRLTAELAEAREESQTWQDRFRKRGYLMDDHAKALERAEAAEKRLAEISADWIVCNEKLIQVERERDNWRESARMFCSNEEYYRGLCDKALNSIGDESYICDDGSRSEDPLRSKLPELVDKLVWDEALLIKERDRYREALERITNQSDESPVRNNHIMWSIAKEALNEK